MIFSECCIWDLSRGNADGHPADGERVMVTPGYAELVPAHIWVTPLAAFGGGILCTNREGAEQEKADERFHNVRSWHGFGFPITLRRYVRDCSRSIAETSMAALKERRFCNHVTEAPRQAKARTPTLIIPVNFT